jgi:small-conductance mechanosensitive channel
MSLLRREMPPPTDAWEGLREWARQTWWQRFRISLLAVAPITTLVFVFAAVALLIAETSWRSAALIVGLWVVCVPLTALGYMRRIGRSAAKVPPISAASLNPTTAVDIRGNREPE